MTDEPKLKDTGRFDEELDLTRSLKALSVSTIVGVEDATLGDDLSHTALLVCRDRSAEKWGIKWLSQFDFKTNLISVPADVLSVARETRPDIIIVEAGLSDSDGVTVFKSLQDAADLNVPLIVLCSNSKEVQAALDAEVLDVVRKPIEWQLVARRARTAAGLNDTAMQIDSDRQSLTEALALAEQARQRLRSFQSFEPVTGLPNKSKFLDLVSRGMNAAERDGNALAVLVIEFNRFGLIVEALGQDGADMIMAEIGDRVRACLEQVSTQLPQMPGLRTAAAANLDSGRFGLMLTCSSEDTELVLLKKTLDDELSLPMQVGGQTVHLSICIGATVFPRDASSADALLQRADNARRDAQQGGGGFKFYSREADAAATRKLEIEDMLYEAFDRQELKLAYQPILDVKSSRVIGAEALLRWPQPDGKSIGPEEFVPIAEECGLMIQLGAWVLDESCRQLQAWQNEGLPPLRMSVNVSRCQLMAGGFAETVKRVLKKYDLDPTRLDLELSERGVLLGLNEAISQLHLLKKLNIQLSIDDFGTGDAAIAYLKELPIDVLKIDRSYINGLDGQGKDTAITSAMVALGQRLDLIVIAEGVETPEQLNILREFGCDEYQGFYQSPAISSEAFAEFIKKDRI